MHKFRAIVLIYGYQPHSGNLISLILDLCSFHKKLNSLHVLKKVDYTLSCLRKRSPHCPVFNGFLLYISCLSFCYFQSEENHKLSASNAFVVSNSVVKIARVSSFMQANI